MTDLKVTSDSLVQTSALLTTEFRCLREGEGHYCRGTLENDLEEEGSDLDGHWEGYSRQNGPNE